MPKRGGQGGGRVGSTRGRGEGSARGRGSGRGGSSRGRGGGRAGTTRGRGGSSVPRVDDMRNYGAIGTGSIVGRGRFQPTKPAAADAPAPSPRTARAIGQLRAGTHSILDYEYSPSGYQMLENASARDKRASEASIAHSHQEFIGPQQRMPSLETMAARAARRGGIPPPQMAQVLTTPQISVVRHRVLREFPHEGRKFFGERPQ